MSSSPPKKGLKNFGKKKNPVIVTFLVIHHEGINGSYIMHFSIYNN